MQFVGTRLHVVTKAALFAVFTWLSLGATALAQSTTTFEFERMFGQFGFYQQCKQGQDQNGFCTRPPNTNPPTGFISPTGADWLTGSRLVIADQGNNKLQLCTLDGECEWRGNDGSGSGEFSGRNMPGTFDLPHGVEVGPNGRIAIADEDNQLLQYCDDTGACVAKGETANTNAGCSSGLGKWCEPHDTAIDEDGLIYAVDTGNNRIQILKAVTNEIGVLELESRATYSSDDQDRRLFDVPGGIAIDLQGRIVVADTGSHRILVCERRGNRLACDSFGGLGTAPGRFDMPTGVDVDHFGRIWVADTNNHRVQVCDDTGACEAFGSFGDFDPASDTTEGGPTEGAGRFNFPHDVAVHPSGQVAVVDTANHRIQIFRTEADCGSDINPGMNDAWYNVDTAGQGFLMTVLPESRTLFIAQFTFDTELPPADVTAVLGAPEHRWITAAGQYCGRTAELTAEMTFGGRFNETTPAPERVKDYGRYTVRFPDCATAILDYDLPAAERSGRITLERIVLDNVALCEALREPAAESGDP